MNEDVATPAVPNAVARKTPIEEQPTHMLEAVLRIEPEKNDLPIFNERKFLMMYMFMLTTIPTSGAVMFERTKPGSALEGMGV